MKHKLHWTKGNLSQQNYSEKRGNTMSDTPLGAMKSTEVGYTESKMLLADKVNYFHNKFKEQGKYVSKRIIEEVYKEGLKDGTK